MSDAHNHFLRWLKESPNNLSFWFPKIKDCGIRVPKTHIIPVPDELVSAFFLEEPGDRERIAAFVHGKVMPVVDSLEGLPFIKNGCFSNKFRFRTCCPPDKKEDTILKSIIDIQYDSFALDTFGGLEIVIRERIPSPKDMPIIYGGMPLNTEFRLFYDFNAHKVLYIVNYWDRNYCRNPIAERNPLDGEAFDRRWPSLEKEYLANKDAVMQAAERCLSGVTGLPGYWSVDLLLDSTGELWLIDMAIAQMSVYWDPAKIG